MDICFIGIRIGYGLCLQTLGFIGPYSHYPQMYCYSRLCLHLSTLDEQHVMNEDAQRVSGVWRGMDKVPVVLQALGSAHICKKMGSGVRWLAALALGGRRVAELHAVRNL